MTDLLFGLPHYLICDVLGNWVGLKSIIRLDSVYVGKCSRETFLDTLKSKELVVTDHDLYTDDFPDNLVEWCVKRRIKLSVFAFGFQTCIAASAATMEEFFKLNGSTLKSFVMHSDNSLDDTAWLKGLAEDCSGLEILEIEKEEADHKVFEPFLYTVLSKHCHTLQKLDLSCGYLHMILPFECSFPVLKEFHPRVCGRFAGLDEFLTNCPLLQRFTGKVSIDDDDGLSFLTTLSTYCPQLRSVNLLDISVQIIPEVIRLCPRGPALHLHFDPYLGVEEADIISVVTSLPNIQSLTLASSKISDEVLLKIKENCANTLRKLSFQDCPPFKFKALLALLKACKHLSILYLNSCCKLTSLQMQQVVKACPELTSLTLLLYAVDDAVFTTIGECLPKLAHLNVEIEDGHRYNTYTLQGLEMVMLGCPKLTKLCMGWHYDALYIDAARKDITLRYPNLHITGPELSEDWFADNSDEIMQSSLYMLIY